MGWWALNRCKQDKKLADILKNAGFELNSLHKEVEPDKKDFVFRFVAFALGLPLQLNLKGVIDYLVVDEADPGAVNKIRRIKRKGGVLLYAPNHVSNLDSFVLGYAIYQMRLPFPIFVAGKNLAKGISRYILPLLGASFLDRELIEGSVSKRVGAAYWRFYAMHVRGWARKRISVLSFLQAGRPYDGLQAEKEAKWRMIDLANRISVEESIPIYVVPIALSYTRVPEDERIFRCAKEGKMKGARSSNLFIAWLNVNKIMKGNPVYVRFFEPIDVREFSNVRKDAHELLIEVLDRATITYTQFSAFVLNNLFKRRYECPRHRYIDECKKRLARLCRKAKKLDAVLRNEDFVAGVEWFFERGVLELKWDMIGYASKDVNILEYYANLGRHHFKV